jgi:sugar O-acyltransferase (sialic acid O-acetyltransferase NeuD family)
MTAEKIVILGAGGHAKSCVELLEQHGLYEIIGLVGTIDQLGIKISGYEVIGTDDDLYELSQEIEVAVNGIGGIGSQQLRRDITDKAKSNGFRIPTIISPHAIISKNAWVGEGTMVFHGAIINSGAKVEENCIINTGAIIEHDVLIKPYCHISTGVTVNGNVTIGDSSFIGSGAVIRENTKIGNNCLIGMGITVRKNIPTGTKFLG